MYLISANQLNQRHLRARPHSKLPAGLLAMSSNMNNKKLAFFLQLCYKIVTINFKGRFAWNFQFGYIYFTLSSWLFYP